MTSGPGSVPGDEDLSYWIRQWRHTRRWTQERLAEALGYEVSYISKIERGQRRASRQFLARLAEIAEVEETELAQLARQPTASLRLPVLKNPVLGREREVQELCELLRDERCVTLVGAPGIGKTTLAVEAGWRTAGDFRNGGCFVGLAEISSAPAVAASVLHHLGLMERGVVEIDDVLGQALQHQELLLILDNFEHVLEARTVVSDLMKVAQNVHILITSREALGLRCERPYWVRPLEFPDPRGPVPEDLHDFPAVKMFVDRSRLARRNFSLDASNAASIMDICARLGGVPLAITLTAKASRILSPADIARSLDARLELETEGDHEPLAHRRLAAALDWSWELLPAWHRSVLAALGVFSGGCSLAAAEAVCGDGHHDVLHALAALERKSLIEVTESVSGASRFECLEPIRRYALAKLAEQGRIDDIRSRHGAYFLALAEASEGRLTAGGHQAEAWTTLEAEHANLAAAFEWSLRAAPDCALRLGAALWRFYSMRRISEGRHWLALALAQASGPPLVRARAMNGLAILARVQGDLGVAEASLAGACGLAEGPEGRRELAFGRLTQGIVAQDRALYEVAEERFVEAMTLYRQIGDERGVGHVLNCLGVVALRRGDIGAAADQFHAALGRFRILGDQWSVAVTATNLGWIAERSGELGEARDWYQESGQMWELSGDEHGRGRSLVSLGRVARLQRRFPDARRLLEEALEIFYRFGDRRLAAACVGELADVAYERRRSDVAARLLGAAATLRADLGTPAWPEEAALAEHVLSALREEMGEAAVERIYAMGATLTIEDVVELVRADRWPPAVRGQRGGRSNGFSHAGSALGVKHLPDR